MLLEKKAEYQKGWVEKDQYYKEMFEIHKHLFEYPKLIKNSPTKKIEITDEQVVFTISNAGNDIKICCDERDAYSLPMTYFNFSLYEAVETEMILRLIKPGDVVFDIGANIGWYTINILLKHKGTSVYSFEPIKSSYEFLTKNLVLNNQKTDKAYNFGFSDENKTVKFYFDINCAMASSMANLREDGNTVLEECEVKKLDDFVLSEVPLEKLDFIKCDVEGAEFFVFKGAIEAIKKYRPVIFAEMLRKWSKKFGYHPNDIIQLLRSINYECYIINDGKLEKFGLVDDETIQTNYLFCLKEKYADTIERLRGAK
jgi:FkbM family methyltransferase